MEIDAQKLLNDTRLELYSSRNVNTLLDDLGTRMEFNFSSERLAAISCCLAADAHEIRGIDETPCIPGQGPVSDRVMNLTMSLMNEGWTLSDMLYIASGLISILAVNIRIAESLNGP